MSARVVRLGLLLASTLTVLSCATLGVGGGEGAEARDRLSRAVLALDRSDFGSATADLEWVASRCGSGERGRTALLLLAAAELDVRNPDRSPDRARWHAEAYLSSPGIPDEELPVARTLYLLAVDMGGTTAVGDAVAAPSPVADGEDGPDAATPRVADRLGGCGEGGSRDHLPLPTHAGPTTAGRLAALQDSVDLLHAEIDRVRKLLKGGGGGRNKER